MGIFNKKNTLRGRVRVNILDPMCGLTAEEFCFGDSLLNSDEYRVEDWDIESINQELYKQWVDPKTKELYMLIAYEEGSPKKILTTKETWDYWHKQSD